MNTQDLIRDAIELRASEPTGRDLWFAVEDELQAEADALHQAGMLDRRWHGEDMVWRLADDAFRKVQAAAATTASMN